MGNNTVSVGPVFIKRTSFNYEDTLFFTQQRFFFFVWLNMCCPTKAAMMWGEQDVV